MLIRYPSEFRLESQMPTGSLVQVFNSGEYWVKDARGVRAMSDSMADDVRGAVQRDMVGLLLAVPGATPLVVAASAAYFAYLAYRIATAPPLTNGAPDYRSALPSLKIRSMAALLASRISLASFSELHCRIGS